MIKKISHIAMVVPDLQQATSFWIEALGLTLGHIEPVPEQAVDVAFLPVGESEIELLEPTDDVSGVARYLSKNGPGMHHICFEVEDMESVLQRLKAAGVPLIDEEPTIGSGGKKIAFVHPKGTGGVLVELYELPPAETEQARLASVRQRLSQKGHVYSAGLQALWSGIRRGESEAE